MALGARLEIYALWRDAIGRRIFALSRHDKPWEGKGKEVEKESTYVILAFFLFRCVCACLRKIFFFFRRQDGTGRMASRYNIKCLFFSRATECRKVRKRHCAAYKHASRTRNNSGHELKFDLKKNTCRSIFYRVSLLKRVKIIRKLSLLTLYTASILQDGHSAIKGQEPRA